MEPALPITPATLDNLFVDRLPPATGKAFLNLSKLSLLEQSDWYLAGGTALALQVGHRQSVDLDFFTPRQEIPELALERQLLATAEWKTTLREVGTIYGEFMGAKLSFIVYPFFIPSPERVVYGTVHLLVPADIAVMKIIAISQRGRKRDFVDLFWYCRNREPLIAVMQRVPQHYPGQTHDFSHFLKSLTYFVDAESDPMPKLFFKTSWPAIKKFFRAEVPQLTKKLLQFQDAN